MELSKKMIEIIGIFTFSLLFFGCDGGVGNNKTYQNDLGGENIFENEEPEKDNCVGTAIAPALLMERTTGKPVEQELTFTKGDFDICIFIESVGEKAPGSASIFINDFAVAQPSNFNANFKSLIRRISKEELAAGEHTLSVKLEGKPTTALKIKITADQPLNQQVGKELYGKEAIYAYTLRERLLREEERTLNFQLSPKNWLTPGELFELIQKAPEGTEVIELYLLIGDKSGTDFLTTPIKINSTQDLLRLREILEEKQEKCLSSTARRCSGILEEVLRGDIDSGKVLIGSFRVSGTPRNMYRFWDDNPDSIRFIQTIAHSIENAQTPFNPDEEL